MNLPAQIKQTHAGSSYLYQYTYGADHERVNLITARPDETITSHYLHDAMIPQTYRMR